MEENTKKPRKLNIPGTKLSVINSQLLISSGIPSLDKIIGSGFPVGTVVLIEEDECAVYSKLLLQYFIAEGIVCEHSTFFGSLEINSSILLNTLPQVINVDEEEKPKSNVPNDDLKIAWRYQNVSTSKTKISNQLGHDYDLSKVINSSDFDKADIKIWNYDLLLKKSIFTFSNPAYHDLLTAIKLKVDEGFMLKNRNPEKSILRIALQSIGSPMWFPTGYETFAKSQQKNDLDTFLFCLKSIVRTALATVVITIPSQIMKKDSVERSIYNSDIVLRLSSFAGTPLEQNKALSDYQGFFHFVKLPGINSLVFKSQHPVDYVFKLRRKKFTIEELHLPPELRESAEREQDEYPMFGCSSGSSKLDF